MFGAEILEVGIGLIFVYALVSIICTAMREGVEAWLKTRAAYLEYGIRELLHDKEGTGLATVLYKHPLIFSLFPNGYIPRHSSKRPALLASGANLPSYIPAKNFALALMDIAARGPKTDGASSSSASPVISLDTVRLNIANIKNPAVQRVLLTLIDSAQDDFNKAQANIEAWYDSAMDRVSGWYKRSTQWVIFAMSLAVVVALNINTLEILDYLYRDDAARAFIVATAEKAAGDSEFLSRTYDDAKRELQSMKLPIGWEQGWRAKKDGSVDSHGVWSNWLAPILGWLLTAFAATMGAPFWFDMLNKVMVIRSTVKPHEKSPEEASEDRQVLRAAGRSAGENRSRNGKAEEGSVVGSDTGIVRQ
jgi:hypothetical protein